MATKKSEGYVVVAPYVTLTTQTTEGPRTIGFYEGAVVPEDVSDESIKHHLDNGLIAKASDAEEALAAAPESEAPAKETPAKGH